MAPTKHITSLLSRIQPQPTYRPPPSLQERIDFFATHPEVPRTLIISCADPRCTPEFIFRLDLRNPSDRAVIIRVQGADWRSAQPAVLAIDQLIKFNHVILLKHTDCGSLRLKDATIKENLKARAGNYLEPQVIEGMKFAEDTISMHESVRRDLKLIKESPLVSDDMKRGLTGVLYHLETGEIEIIDDSSDLQGKLA
ncbi:hypothetical protein DV735_g5906, partial [Chaetothyriales sp. CBS 134920]